MYGTGHEFTKIWAALRRTRGRFQVLSGIVRMAAPLAP
jgi:hypothetical protein